MDLRSQQRVHAQPRPDATAAALPTRPAVEAQPKRPIPKIKRSALYGVAAILAVGVLGLAVKGAMSFTGGSGVLGAATSTPSVSTGKYQALFLTNGQVYFGKIVGMSADTVTMRDIYYLQ